MDTTRLTGPGSGAIKYDILTALSVAGLNGTSGDQLSMTRLISLITARYNWRTDELSMGQREMASLWGVGERTAKREVKRWLTSGLLLCRRAGVRGRVASYRLNFMRICEVTSPFWSLVGTDFAARMSHHMPAENRVIRLDAHRVERPTVKVTGWESVRDQLAALFPAQFEAWIAPLVARNEGDFLFLEAKSGFAAEYVKTHFGRDILDAFAASENAPSRIVIRGPDARGGLASIDR